MNQNYFTHYKESFRCRSVTLLTSSFLVLSMLSSSIQARILKVGPGQEFALPSIAAQFAKDGDVVEIDAGIYYADAAVWKQNNLVIRGMGGLAVLEAAGASAKGKAIWVIKGDNITIQSIEFANAKVSDGNGAGIRMQGGDLTIKNSIFRNNQNGILGGSSKSRVIVENSEFTQNGSGDGRTHNIYAGKLRSFTIKYSYIHEVKIGHNIKSRAAETYILYNRIMDERNGSSSYAIDIPNGGIAYIIGNLIQQGNATENSTIVNYGAKKSQYPENELYFINNTVVNDRTKGGNFIKLRSKPDKLVIMNNLFVGKGRLIEEASSRTNLLTQTPQFLQRMRYNYRLQYNSPAINAGADPGMANGISLTPDKEYVQKAQSRPRTIRGKIDIGAFEFVK